MYWPYKKFLLAYEKPTFKYIWQRAKFAAIETEYLGLNISWQGEKPQEKKIEAILNIATPTNDLQVGSFLGTINHYKQMIPHHSHVATDLTELTKKGAKFNWSPNCQDSLDIT